MLTPVLLVPHACNETAEWLKKQLSQNGWKVLQTFELQDARLGSADCACPHHGTQQCDCDMVVFLVYAREQEPVTLILHGSDGQTRLSFADDPNHKVNAGSVTAIRQALEIETASFQ
jgi:hypothetical protein